jgi:hypothetical protein
MCGSRLRRCCFRVVGLRTSAGRRAALRETREEHERERPTEHDAEAQTEERESVAIELDPARFVTRAHGRRAWLREGRRALEERRALEARPVARATIEPVFGQLKFNRRLDRFLRRGRSAVRSEWRLFGASHNPLKLHYHRTAATAA